MTALPLPDVGLPGLEPLLNGPLWAAWAQAGRVSPVLGLHAAVRHLSLEPGERCRLALFAGEDGEDVGPSAFLVDLLPDAGLAREALERLCAREPQAVPGGFEPFCCEDSAAVVSPFPNDPDLPGLRRALDPDAFAAARAQPGSARLLHYEPGRRATFRLEPEAADQAAAGPPALAWWGRPGAAERARSSLTLVHERVPEDAAWAVPRPLPGRGPAGLWFREWVQGRSLLACLAEDGDAALARAGEALARLHALDAPLEHRPSPQEEGEAARKRAERLALLLPDHRARLRRFGRHLQRLLARLVVEPGATVHGDFHAGHVLFPADGPGPVLVDFDAAGLGYAALDVGTLRAELMEREASPAWYAAFQRGYERAGAAPLQDELVRIATAVALFRRADRPLRGLRPDWPDQMARRLAWAEQVVSDIDP